MSTKTGLHDGMRVAVFEYDFAKHGGAVGDIVVYGSGIPDGAEIWDGVVSGITAATSGGAATVALKILTAADLLAATGYASFTATAKVATVPVGTAASAIRMTSAVNSITVTVAAAALTAGKFAVKLMYFPPAN